MFVWCWSDFLGVWKKNKPKVLFGDPSRFPTKVADLYMKPITSLNIILPIPSMYGILTYIYHKNQLNVGKYTIHGDGMG